ncbi:MAG: IS4 family transposase [Idiomarina sp. 34-48-12]|nr:MAG: IS4 family transposase [Idiomarina sp. 34-48-12]
MFLSQALDQLQEFTPDDFSKLPDLLEPELIEQCLENAGVTTVRKRRLPMDFMVWAVVGMALFRDMSMRQLVSHLDLMLPGNRPYVAPSAVVQARQRLGSDVMKRMFELTNALWFEKLPTSHWHNLSVLAVDGTVWRTPDTLENSVAYGRTANLHKESDYPQIRMVNQMEVSSHLVTATAFGSVAEVGEVDLASQLIEQTPDYSLTLFDKGFYALGLLDKWHRTGKERHWLIPLKKGAQYSVIKSVSRTDKLVEIQLSPQARKKWEGASVTVTARLVSKKIGNKNVEILTSMTDTLRYPEGDIVDLYTYRWEIEQAYREMKQYMLKNELTLRSKRPDLVEQELWGMLIAYNLLRYMMAQMAYSLKHVEPNQISFKQASHYLVGQLHILVNISPGKISKVMEQMLEMASAFVLPERRERHYPRAIKKRPQRYPMWSPSKTARR